MNRLSYLAPRDIYNRGTERLLWPSDDATWTGVPAVCDGGAEGPNVDSIVSLLALYKNKIESFLVGVNIVDRNCI